MKTYIISHNDLDGFSSQLIVKENTDGEKILLNVNYGKELSNTINSVLEKITKNDFLFITDLNLDDEQAFILSESKEKIGFTLQVIDHHETGKNVSLKYDWYLYDKNYSATKLTWFFFSRPPEFEFLAELTDIYDLYRDESHLFNKAKSLNEALILRRKIFPKELDCLQRKFNFFLIKNYSNIIFNSQNIMESESKLYLLERSFFDPELEMSNLTLKDLSVRYMYEHIVNNKLYTYVEIAGYQIEIYKELSDIFQEFSHKRLSLVNDKNNFFVCNINKQGYIGFRSEKITGANVEEFAKKYFNGGGHKNASGGSLPGVKSENKKYKKEELIDTFINSLKSQTM